MKSFCGGPDAARAVFSKRAPWPPEESRPEPAFLFFKCGSRLLYAACSISDEYPIGINFLAVGNTIVHPQLYPVITIYSRVRHQG